MTLVHRGQQSAILRADLWLGSHAATITQNERMVKLFYYEP